MSLPHMNDITVSDFVVVDNAVAYRCPAPAGRGF